MELSIGEFNTGISGNLDMLNRTGDPMHIKNVRRRDSPTEAVLAPAELWDVLMSLPGAKKRVREFTAAKQADGGDELPEVA